MTVRVTGTACPPPPADHMRLTAACSFVRARVRLKEVQEIMAEPSLANQLLNGALDLLFPPSQVLPRYGDPKKTVYVDRREQVAKNPKGKKNDKSHTDVGMRTDRSNLTTVVIHIMEVERNSDITKFDAVNAHFAVLRSGAILHLHDVSQYMFSSHDFNASSIAVEFEGNYPHKIVNGKYKWWSDTYEKPRSKQDGPTIAQIKSGRALVRYFKDRYGIQHIYGHRQSCAKVCPGPHLWYNIVKWGVDALGLSDGGTGYTTSNDHCTGAVIPSSWRDPIWKVDLNPFSDSTYTGPGEVKGSACVPP